MIKICLLLLSVMFNVQAASSDYASLFSEGSEYDAAGVKICTILFAENSRNRHATACVAHGITSCLTKELTGNMECPDAHNRVSDALKMYQENMSEPVRSDLKVCSLFIMISLAKSKVIIRVHGNANSGAFQTFLPPYSIVSSGMFNA